MTWGFDEKVAVVKMVAKGKLGELMMESGVGRMKRIDHFRFFAGDVCPEDGTAREAGSGWAWAGAGQGA